MTRIGITGGYGFLGWHTACRMRAVHGAEPVALGRDTFADSETLATSLAHVDGIIHLAGVNRADSSDAIEDGNVGIARTLAGALSRLGRPMDLVYANTIHADTDTAYGRGKARAAEILRECSRKTGGSFIDLLLPNVFGEHGRPWYNSFVATFAHEIAAGREPVVNDDRDIPLLHAQGAASTLLQSLGADGRRSVDGEPRSISGILEQLREIHELYARDGTIPPLPGRFEVDLFNTYRAAAFPQMWPLSAEVHSDDRGDLFETVRTHGGGQTFVSTTRPGQTRGDHYHLHRVERFFVVKGEAEIAVRRLLHNDVVRYRLSGDSPSFIDMPTLWVHNIRNAGDRELVTLFWSNQLFDPNRPDQFAEKVGPP